MISHEMIQYKLYNMITYDLTTIFHICWLFCFVMQVAWDGSPATRAYYIHWCFLGVLVMLHRIAVAGIDDSALGFGETFHKKPGIDGKKIYIYRNAFINKFGADSWDAFYQSTTRVCGISLLLEIGSLPFIVEGTLSKNRPIWNSTSVLPQHFARIKNKEYQGYSIGLSTIYLQALVKFSH